MERAIYQAKEAPEYRMTFGRGYDVSAISGVVATITGEGGERLADLSITWSMGYTVAFYTATSGHVPGVEIDGRIVGNEDGGRIVGLSREFAYEGPPGHPTGEAPYALILPDIGGWLYNSTKHEEGKSIPEGAWILAECR
ncbi:MAG: hypothetical protein ACK4KX_03200 [Parvibaculum sp.]|uniref:hypothetical protein n=1 Tax=Parvibaculum sp. TaxID=2024848 RepID=UPI00391C8CD7